MKKFLIGIGIVLAILLIAFVGLVIFASFHKTAYQRDADLIRMEHLNYWSGLIEDYHAKTGTYPFQNLTTPQKPLMIRIATANQRSYMVKGGSHYKENIDFNREGYFQERPVKDFVTELETKLGHPIDEKYDIQKVPTRHPVGYVYFATDTGYLLYVTCITCGTTPISTLLMNGLTPTINIVSEGMKGKVTKALPREEMLNHPLFKQWQQRSFKKEGYARQQVEENLHDSKTGG